MEKVIGREGDGKASAATSARNACEKPFEKIVEGLLSESAREMIPPQPALAFRSYSRQRKGF